MRGEGRGTVLEVFIIICSYVRTYISSEFERFRFGLCVWDKYMHFLFTFGSCAIFFVAKIFLRLLIELVRWGEVRLVLSIFFSADGGVMWCGDVEVWVAWEGWSAGAVRGA